jgi:hypothetical protein
MMISGSMVSIAHAISSIDAYPEAWNAARNPHYPVPVRSGHSKDIMYHHLLTQELRLTVIQWNPERKDEWTFQKEKKDRQGKG